jgi:non-ribosomal peptide synthetase component F
MAGLSTQDQHLFKGFSFGEHRDLPFRCVHQAIAYHAAAHPDSIAVEHLDDKLSYSELERRGNILAARLQSMGVRPGSRVCLLARRSIIMVVGVVGIMKAGGVYVPLDGGIVTQSTLEHVIRDSRSILIMAPAEFHYRVQNMGVPVHPLDDFAFLNDTAPHAKLQGLSHPSDGIYVIYTSGNVLLGHHARYINATTQVLLASQRVWRFHTPA